MKHKVLEQIPELTRVSSKGQIVIPKDYRDRLEVKEGNIFAVSNPTKDMIILKKIKNPIVEEDLETIKSVKEAWDDIEEGNYIKSSKKDFLNELNKW